LREVPSYALDEKLDKFRLISLVFVWNAKNDNRAHADRSPKAFPQRSPMMLLHHEYDIGVLNRSCVEHARSTGVKPG